MSELKKLSKVADSSLLLPKIFHKLYTQNLQQVIIFILNFVSNARLPMPFDPEKLEVVEKRRGLT